MKRRKELIKSEPDLIFFNGKVLIQENIDSYSFEIGREVTSDLAEAVAILMKMDVKDEEIWNLEIKNIDTDKITPAKCLYWLTGGYEEWNTLENYRIPWSECYLDFQEEFGFMIINIIKKSKNLSDIKNGFVKYLNLPTIYDFALSLDIVK
jgi:hypothetical protein